MKRENMPVAVCRKMNRVVDDLEHVLHDLDLVCRDIGFLVQDIDRVTSQIEQVTGVDLEALDDVESSSTPLIRVNFASEAEEAAEEAAEAEEEADIAAENREFERFAEFQDDELFEAMSIRSDSSGPSECPVTANAELQINLSLNTWSSFTVDFSCVDPECGEGEGPRGPEEGTDFFDDDAFENSEHLTSLHSDSKDLVAPLASDECSDDLNRNLSDEQLSSYTTDLPVAPAAQAVEVR